MSGLSHEVRLLAELRELGRAYRAARNERDAARCRRDAALLQARVQGATLQELADITGLTRARVHQILKRQAVA